MYNSTHNHIYNVSSAQLILNPQETNAATPFTINLTWTSTDPGSHDVKAGYYLIGGDQLKWWDYSIYSGKSLKDSTIYCHYPQECYSDISGYFSGPAVNISSNIT